MCGFNSIEVGMTCIAGGNAAFDDGIVVALVVVVLVVRTAGLPPTDSDCDDD